MKKYLMRAQIQHDKAFTPQEVFLGNLMGGNIGNWLYQFSLFRALMIDETVSIDTVNFVGKTVDKKYIKFVNENYDAFILPLANAFKNSFEEELLNITKLIKGLKIPCIVIGVGIQCKFDKEFSQYYKLKEPAEKFVKAVLNKSQMIGVRGEQTGEFLKGLGLREEIDYTVIGCPSMYLHGAHLPDPKPFNYDSEKLFAYNSKVEHEKKEIVAFLTGFTREHPNYIYVPQRLGDIIRCYYGVDFRRKQIKTAPNGRFFEDEKTRLFASPYEWIKYMSDNVDFSIGTRLHGNVAAILGGVPTFIIANDQRVEELARYHNIAHTTIKSMRSGTKIRELTEGVDFSCVKNGHNERFNHFVDFLEKNGLKNAYSADRNVSKVYFDEVLKGLDFSEDVMPFAALSGRQKLIRTRKAAVFYNS